ncbi:ABC transporter ATP-binding protein [Phaeacidiphilus oryzae]|uniref:ABC transporter ATP-binding protein n=1 Tax=Phaeacidiphilus oryzae TaxID=348818 RepID=UPI000AC6770D|nr:ATP-binding cassette domain-containing protein [Phaeacidiphilus oryzae]
MDRAELSVPAARITALTGPNGAGKSTLFDCLAGAARPSAGRVLLSGRDVTRLPPHARSRLGLARTFQHLAVFPSLTVAENLRLGADRTPDPPATVAAVLDRLGLTRLRDHPADGLPTGTLRLVELGRALAARPRVLLLDEPAAGLDHAETAGLDELLRTLAVGDGIALLLVEHDAELVSRLADRVYTMTAGRLALAEGGRG